MRHTFSFVTVLALAGAGLCLPVVTTSVPTSHPVATTVTTMPVTALDAATRGATETSVPGIAALTQQTETAAFMLAGVTWDHDAAVDVTSVMLRLREAGTWSGWTTLTLADDPDAADGESRTTRSGTEPLTTTGADGIQVQMRTADGALPRNTQIELVEPGDSDTDEVKQVVAGSVASAATAKDVLEPNIVTRAQWGADEKLGSSWNVYLSKVSALTVHHTAGTNAYTKAQAPKLVRGILAYHTKSLRWSDVGYQFLVDKYGTIYQGRRGATVDNPIGAQTGGYNSATIGVSALGNYDVVKPTAALVEALTEVLAWKAYDLGLDPTGKATLVTGTSSKSATRARAGTSVRVNVIQGHRDTNYTACPGRYLYALLPSIRADVTQRVRDATITAGTKQDILAAPQVSKPSTSQAPVQWSGTSAYRWRAVKGAKSYQILVQSSSSYRSGAPSSRTWSLYKSVSGTSASVTTSRGATRTIAVRAVDSRGRRGPMTLLATTARPVPSNSVVKSKKAWKTKKSKSYWSGSALRTTKKRATLTLTKVKSARSVSLRALRGPQAGSVTVSIGSWSKAIDLRRSVTDSDAVITVKFDRVRSGTLKVTTRSSKPVAISGIGVGRVNATVPPARAVRPAAPAVATPAAVDVVTTSAATVTWKSAARATSYAVYARSLAPTAADYGDWVLVTSTTGRKADVAVPTGETWQVAVLAKRGAALSRATAVVTRVGALNLDSLVRSAEWTLTPASGNSAKQLQAAGQGASLKLPIALGTASLRLKLATGAGQGTLLVQSGSTVLATVSAATAVANAGGWVDVPLSAVTDGRLTLQTVNDDPITLTAVAAVRSLT